MNIETRNYAMGTSLVQSYPWGLYWGGKAMCPDGRVRALKRIASTADTFFSVPAAVTYKGKTVAGYVTVETVAGYTTATADDPAIVRFVPYSYRKNGSLFSYDHVCRVCAAPIQKVVEAHATYWEDQEGDSLRYVPTLHDHAPHS